MLSVGREIDAGGEGRSGWAGRICGLANACASIADVSIAAGRIGALVDDAVAVVVDTVAELRRARVNERLRVVAVGAAADAGWVAVVVAVERLEGADARRGIAALVGCAGVGVCAVRVGRAGVARLTARCRVAGLAGTAQGRRYDVAAGAARCHAAVDGTVHAVVAVRGGDAAGGTRVYRRNAVIRWDDGVHHRDIPVRVNAAIGIAARTG